MGYRVEVDDNYHYQDADERYGAGEFETLDEAVAACRRMVDESLRHLHESGMSAEELWQRYTMFGEDPFVVGGKEPVPFSAWTYAKERCSAICGTVGGPRPWPR